jgi:hypothetical protein
MFNSARTSARTLLVAASAASFVALGAGIAGADALGGATDGLPLNDLGNQVPASLTEGVATPLGDLVKVTPGEVSAAPEIDHNSAPVTGGAGESVSTDVPLEVSEDNAADLGPLGLVETLPLSDAAGTASSVDPADVPGTVTGAVGGQDLGTGPVSELLATLGTTAPDAGAVELPRESQYHESLANTPVEGVDPVGEATGALLGSQSDVVPLSNPAGDPLSGLIGGLPVDDVLAGVTGGLPTGTLPMSAPTAGQSLDELNGTVKPATNGQPLNELNGTVKPLTNGQPLNKLNGTVKPATNGKPLHQAGPADQAEGTVSEVGALADSGTEQVGGGLVGLDEKVAMAGTDQPIAVDAGENTDLTGGAAGLLGELVPAQQTLPMADGAGAPELPETGAVTDALGDVTSSAGAADTEALPMAAPDTSAVTDLVGTDTLGGDVASVNGLPSVGQPTVETERVTGLVPGGLV